MDTIDVLHGIHFLLHDAKRDVPDDIGILTTLCTRHKIYVGCRDVVRLYKKKQDYTRELNRTLRLIRIHRRQQQKLNNATTSKNIAFFTLLEKLMDLFRTSEIKK